MKNKIIDNLYKIILVTSIICFSIALIGATLFCVNRSYNYLNPVILISGTILYLFTLKKVYKIIKERLINKKRIIILVLLIIQFILLFISTRLIHSIPKVDLLHILTGINSLHNTGSLINIEYFSVYPNNRFILLVLNFISMGTNNEIIYSLFSSLCITIMSLFVYLSVKEISNENKGLLSLIICVTSPIFYLYVSYYYTDILMLPLSTILFYLIIKNEKTTNKKLNILYLLLIGVVSVIAYKIRAVSIFVLIAYFVYIILTKNIKKLKYFIPIILTMFLTLTLITKVENQVFKDAIEEKEMPLTHWIMMGVNSEKNGYYDQNDYNLSQSVDTKKERVNLNLSMIGKRIVNNGLFGNIKLILTKIVSVWGKGDYSYQKYLDLSLTYNKTYDYLIKDKNIILNYILQIILISILTMSITSLIKLKKENTKSIIAIALFGGIIFYLIWEVCPRYGLSFLPWLIILTSYSYEEKIITKPINIIPKYILLASTIITLIIGAFMYTNKKYKEDLVSKDTNNKTSYQVLNNTNVIEQTLSLNRNFNEIKLRFKYLVKTPSKYTLYILDKDHNIKETLNFTKETLKNDEYSTFKLKNTLPRGDYIIKLRTDEKDSLEVITTNKEEFDFYKDGKLYINNEEQKGDLMFEVLYYNKRSTYNIIIYLLLSLLYITYLYKVLFRK